MIRFANESDIPKLLDLLKQVCLVHHVGRPDIFKVGTKYSEEELYALLKSDNMVILVDANEDDLVQGYCFGFFQQQENHGVLTDIKTLYIDDLCVDQTVRGQRIGKRLYEAAVALAKEHGCYNVTLNVWTCNSSAMAFYESCGLTPQKICMEQIL